MTPAQRRLARVAAHVVALTALAVIGLRPSLPARVRPGAVLLLTPGATDAEARRWADSLGVERVVRLPAVAATVGEEIPHVEWLARPDARVSVLFVGGWGLEGETWRDVARPIVHLLPNAPPPGFDRVTWPATALLGRPLAVAGTVSGLTGAAWVRLVAPGGPADSARVAPEAPSFNLSDRPRATGPAAYVLSLSGHPELAETLGVTVAAPEPPAILVLEDAPSFETRALRDWQAARGGRVAIRTRTGLDRFRYDVPSGERLDLRRLTLGIMAGFDLVVVDVATLAALGKAERTALREAVAERGVGLLVRLEPQAPSGRAASGLPERDRSFFLGFDVRAVADSAARTARPSWPDRPPAPGGGLPVEGVLRSGFGVASLVTDTRGAPLAQVAPRGAGRVGLTAIGGTARWIRAGDGALHDAYWSHLVGELARRRDAVTVEADGPLLVDAASALRVRPARDSLLVAQGPSGGRDTVYLAPDREDPGLARGTFWAREPGWHRLTDGQGEAGWLLVAPDGAWPAWRARSRLEASARHLAWSATGVGRTPEPLQRGSRPVPLLPFFLLFLGAAAWLWSERRPVARRLP